MLAYFGVSARGEWVASIVGAYTLQVQVQRLVPLRISRVHRGLTRSPFQNKINRFIQHLFGPVLELNPCSYTTRLSTSSSCTLHHLTQWFLHHTTKVSIHFVFTELSMRPGLGIPSTFRNFSKLFPCCHLPMFMVRTGVSCCSTT